MVILDSVDEYVESLLSYRNMADTIACHKEIPEKKPVYSNLEQALPEKLTRLLEQSGLTHLYTHQAEAINKIRKGEHTVVSTPTASGKTYIFNIPVLESVLENKSSRALYLYPLKALAQDQLKNLKSLFSFLNEDLTASVYDGDTTAYKRRKIRLDPPHIILSNPEMIHLSMLPYHEKWGEFLKNLKYIVVDEVHTCRGITGTHISWVLRRLIRICRYYGASPLFIFCSATIHNPGQLTGSLTGLDVSVVQESGAPETRKHFIMLNTTINAARASILLLHSALHRGLRTIVYTRSRVMTELISLWMQERTSEYDTKISSYRSGFLPEERRDIEQKLSSGELLAVISTSALEMGIDIGALDLCILVGYPGSVMATWQRAGRVGRRDKPSAVIFIGRDDPLDQYFMNHPNEFFTMPPETAVIDPTNPIIMKKHLECAAAELPIQAGDKLVQPTYVSDTLKMLHLQGKLFSTETGDKIVSFRKYPHRKVSLRGTGENLQILSVNNRKVIGQIDRHRAFFETYPGAVYIHNGTYYVITELDIDKNSAAYAQERKTNYFTRIRSEKETEILDIYEQKRSGATVFFIGKVRITETIKGYEKILNRGHRLLSFVPLSLPPVITETECVWFLIPDSIHYYLLNKQIDFKGGIHALEHAAIGILPLIVMADRNDIGGLSTPWHHQTKKSTVFIYDGFPGGVGLSRAAYESVERVMDHTVSVIKGCSCDNGCPSCIQSPKCGSGNKPLDKESALTILKLLKREDNYEAPVDLKRVLHKRKDPNHRVKNHGDKIHFGVLDIETRRSAKDVGGWHRSDKMGISCSVLFDSKSQSYETYYQDDTEKLVEKLKEFDLVIGFNIKRFDYNVLSGIVKYDYRLFPTLDLLDEVKEVLGYRLSLDHLAGVTLGEQKTADGLIALRWWKEGKLKKIADYCRKDVEVTKNLYLFGRDMGYLLFETKKGDKLRIPVNWP